MMTQSISIGNVTVSAEYQREGDYIKNYQNVKDRYRFLVEKPKEHLYALFLNSGNELITEKLIGVGTAQTCTIDTSDIVRTAALTNATAVILVHNHPSGDSSPSQQDIEGTKEAAAALDLLNIVLLDHVIVARKTNTSMKKHRPTIVS